MSESEISKAERMEALFRAGATYRQIGIKFGVSKQAIQSRLRRRGVTATDGGISLQFALHAEQRRQCFRKLFGCDRQQWKEYCALGMRRPYLQQRKNAKKRGIEFTLTFGEFAALWILSGHWSERGSNDREYVMGRFGDSGPYSWTNVEIITCNQNMTMVQSRRYVPSFLQPLVIDVSISEA